MRSSETTLPSLTLLPLGGGLRLPWQRVDVASLCATLDRLEAGGARFVSIGHARAVRAGLAESAPNDVLLGCDRPTEAFARELWPRLRDDGRPCALFLELPGLIVRRGPLARVTPRLGWSTLRALVQEGLAVETRGFAELENDRWPPEQVFGALLRGRREVEKRLGRAPVAYLGESRRLSVAFLDLLGRAGYELPCSAGEDGALLRPRPLRSLSTEIRAAAS